MELQVLDNKGKQKDKVQFDEALLENKASKHLLHEVVTAHLANQRQGTHATKTRAQVRGGGIKPWRQKGTGRARAGSIRSPLWRKGGIIFGPNPRSYTLSLSKKKKKTAFKMALQTLFGTDRFQLVESIKVEEPKTKLVAAVYKKWKAPADSFYVVDKIDPTFNRAARNINTVDVLDVDSLNTYDCLKARKIYMTPEALEQLTKRLSSKTEK